MKLAMVIDSSRCLDCKACMLACKSANMLPTGCWRNWVKKALPANPQASGATAPPNGHFQPGACMHCQDAICVDACPSGATSRNPATGEVLIDKGLCIGCGACVHACPYEARYIHPQLHVADKCDYCAARRAEGLNPCCVDTCPTKARTFGDLDDPASPAALRLDQFAGKAVQVENAVTPTAPQMIYVKDTAPRDWPRPAEISTPIALMGIARPVLSVFAGFTGLGIIAAMIRQVVLPDTPKHDTKADAMHAAKKEDSHE